MIYTLGESLLDIIVNSINDTVIRPGGAMLNTSVSLARSGLDVSLITELGDDDTAKLITDFLVQNKVITKYIRSYQNNITSLALAFLDENKKPKYTFVKNYPDVRKLSSITNFNNNDILLFGSLYSVDKKIRQNIMAIISNAKKNNTTLIYDPNIRNAHHLVDNEIKNAIYENIKIADIIKGSDEDFTNIFSDNDTSFQLKQLREVNKNALIIITLGADGIIANYNNITIKLPANNVNVISTIGAGDAFNAGVIYALIQHNIFKSDFNNKLPLLLKDVLTSGLTFSGKVCASLDNYID